MGSDSKPPLCFLHMHFTTCTLSRHRNPLTLTSELSVVKWEVVTCPNAKEPCVRLAFPRRAWRSFRWISDYDGSTQETEKTKLQTAPALAHSVCELMNWRNDAGGGSASPLHRSWVCVNFKLNHHDKLCSSELMNRCHQCFGRAEQHNNEPCSYSRTSEWVAEVRLWSQTERSRLLYSPATPFLSFLAGVKSAREPDY